jgi:hypothetical protein
MIVGFASGALPALEVSLKYGAKQYLPEGDKDFFD